VRCLECEHRILNDFRKRLVRLLKDAKDGDLVDAVKSCTMTMAYSADSLLNPKNSGRMMKPIYTAQPAYNECTKNFRQCWGNDC
jgi:hypothetical protein